MPGTGKAASKQRIALRESENIGCMPSLTLLRQRRSVETASKWRVTRFVFDSGLAGNLERQWIH